MDPVRLLTDRYRLIERLGSGGMSVVWKAYDEVLGRPVAVKMLSGTFAGDAASRDLIRGEAQAAGRLSHPHVTSVYDYGEALEPDGTRVPFVVMELVDGVALDVRLARGPLPWLVATHVTAEVAAALAAAHARGLVHRDIKPANVMLTPTGAKVVDFGIAAVVGANADSSPILLGTPAYLAPERLLGHAVTPASDVYALGLLLFRTLTGRLPWEVDTVTQMIDAHVYTEPEPLPEVTGLPPAIAALCARSLAKQPEDRPTAADVARALADAAGIRVPLPSDEALNWESTDAEDMQTTLIPVDAAATGSGTAALNTAAASFAASFARKLPGRRRLLVSAGSAAAALAAIGLVSNAWPAAGDEPQKAAAAQRLQVAPPNAQPLRCEVRYQTRSDTGQGFAVDVTVVNKGEKPAPSWTLRFEFDGDQTMVGGAGAAWRQSGREIIASAETPLMPGGSATASFNGGYRTSNPLPTAFTLNGAECRATLAGAAVAPASPAAVPDNQGTGAGSGSGGNGWQGGRGSQRKKGDHGDGDHGD